MTRLNKLTAWAHEEGYLILGIAAELPDGVEVGKVYERPDPAAPFEEVATVEPYSLLGEVGEDHFALRSPTPHPLGWDLREYLALQNSENLNEFEVLRRASLKASLKEAGLIP